MKLNKFWKTTAALLSVAFGPCTLLAQADVRITQNGTARAVIYVAPAVMAPNPPGVAGTPVSQKEKERQRLRDSVLDLALYLGKISGAKVPVREGTPADTKATVPILIGDLAIKAFGGPAKRSPEKQGWRIVVSPKGVGLMGENDMASSFAIYELLDRLGCRWYLPGEWGEVIPSQKTISLRDMDISEVPPTISRAITYADQTFRLRNRLQESQEYLSTTHALEVHSGDRYGYLTKQQLEEHPDWNAQIGGKRSINGRFCWANHEVSEAVAEGVIAHLDKYPAESVSLSPEDGSTFCECEKCKALDSGDWDTSMNQASITDRFVHFANRVAIKVVKKYSNVKFGFLAYAQYTRAPVREKLHPNLVPQIAPITYCRAHTMQQHICPSRQEIRKILEGWGKASRSVAYYNYMFHLAEITVPYPMMKQMSDELPIMYANNVNHWTPETMPTFDSTLPGMVLTTRATWHRNTKPEAVLNEFFTRFYGAAAVPMRRYWQAFDDAWTQVPEHAGCGFGYLPRFTPQFMQLVRGIMNSALAAAKTPDEKQRVQMQNHSLQQFELFMKMRHDLHEGRLASLDADSKKWLQTQNELGKKYAPQYAFSKVDSMADGIGGSYFRWFFASAYTDAGRITRDFTVISPPLNKWRYQVDKDKKGEALGWSKADFNDTGWKTTDPMVNTWYALGLEGYYGPMWYRQTVQVPHTPAGKKVYLWVSNEDGNVKVYVNGRHVPYVNDKGERSDEFTGFGVAASFDITDSVKPGAQNQITIVGTRVGMSEIGTGGLLSPVYLYREK